MGVIIENKQLFKDHNPYAYKTLSENGLQLSLFVFAVL